MPSFAEVREEITAKREQLHKIFEEAGPDLDMSKVTLIDGDANYKAGEINRRNDELTGLGVEFDRLHSLDLIRQLNEHEHKNLTAPVSPFPQPGSNGAGFGGYGSNGYGGYGGAPQQKSIRQLLQEHKGFKAFRENNMRGSVTIDLPYADFKTLVTLTTISPQADRQMLATMGIELRRTTDLMLQGETVSNTVDYYRETTFTNAAAETAENTAAPEGVWAVTLQTDAVRDIPWFVPVTRDALDDVPFLESQLRGRLADGVLQREELQVLVGDGIAPNIQGLLNRTGIQTQAKGADPTPDTVYKAMQLVRGSAGSGFAEPTAFVVHPGDWTDIKLLRTTDGIYIWGNPSDEGPDRIWGLPVRQTTNITSGTGLVGAFRPYAEVFRRQGITVTLSTENEDYFLKRKVAVMGLSRMALAVYRPSAFATCTGI